MAKVQLFELIRSIEDERRTRGSITVENFIRDCRKAKEDGRVDENMMVNDASIMLREIRHKWGDKNLHGFLVDTIARINE